jgi:hypothetical protein
MLRARFAHWWRRLHLKHIAARPHHLAASDVIDLYLDARQSLHLNRNQAAAGAVKDGKLYSAHLLSGQPGYRSVVFSGGAWIETMIDRRER